jgi:succinate dehydrogenase / fumarate reductase iron-sulfur subunit
MASTIEVSIYRYNPETDQEPAMRSYSLETGGKDLMVLDVLERLKQSDPTLVFRRSCREGVCGSDGLNINGKNGLACTTRVSHAMRSGPKLILRPLPGLPVIRDLVVDMSLFYRQLEKAKPWLMNDEMPPDTERLQTPEQRDKLNGLYECILCACCSTGCPSWWWNPDKFLGPAALLNAYRFIEDSRDTALDLRLDGFLDRYSVYRCHNIQNCANVCPKGLNPMGAIDGIRLKLAQRGGR